MIAAVVAIGEEILFRGVIQTHFGLIAIELIFALVHYRYLFNWFLFVNIIALSFLIGFIYLQTENILVTIFMHFLIDFLIGCIIRYKYIKKQRNRKGYSMNKEDPYRDQAEKLRQKIERKQFEEGQVVEREEFPPRSRIHHQKTKEK